MGLMGTLWMAAKTFLRHKCGAFVFNGGSGEGVIRAREILLQSERRWFLCKTRSSNCHQAPITFIFCEVEQS